MKLHLFCVLGLSITVSYGQTEINAIKATVNDEVITQSEVNSAVSNQVQLFILENREGLTQAVLDAKVKEVEGQALEEMIDRKLILHEFSTKGGTIQPYYIDNAVDDFILNRFDGDRSKFLQELKDTGLSIAEFKRIQEEQIAIRALRAANSGGQIINTPFEIDDIYARRGKEFADNPTIRVRILSVRAVNRKLIEELRQKIINAVSSVIEDNDLRLLYVESKDYGAIPPKSEIAEQLDRLLTQEKKKEAIKRWLERLRRDANIRIN